MLFCFNKCYWSELSMITNFMYFHSPYKNFFFKSWQCASWHKVLSKRLKLSYALLPSAFWFSHRSLIYWQKIPPYSDTPFFKLNPLGQTASVIGMGDVVYVLLIVSLIFDCEEKIGFIVIYTIHSYSCHNCLQNFILMAWNMKGQRTFIRNNFKTILLMIRLHRMIVISENIILIDFDFKISVNIVAIWFDPIDVNNFFPLTSRNSFKTIALNFFF